MEHVATLLLVATLWTLTRVILVERTLDMTFGPGRIDPTHKKNNPQAYAQSVDASMDECDKQRPTGNTELPLAAHTSHPDHLVRDAKVTPPSPEPIVTDANVGEPQPVPAAEDRSCTACGRKLEPVRYHARTQWAKCIVHMKHPTEPAPQPNCEQMIYVDMPCTEACRKKAPR